MAESTNPYLLPGRTPLPKGDDTFEPRRFKQLMEQLPIGNIGQVAQDLHQLLQRMNASIMPVASRVSNLEALANSLMVVLEALEKGYARIPLPLSRRATLMADMHGSLCILATQGYKVVLDQYHLEHLTGQLLHKANRALALHRVLYFLGRRLLQEYQLYRPAPAHIWREIHGIHHYACDQKLADRQVGNLDRRLPTQATVNDLYKQILLLSLAGPYRLLQGEAVRVYLALPRWVPEARLLDLGRSSSDDGPFIVDIGSDEPPRRMGGERDHQVQRGWVLDTSDLAVGLASELEAVDALHGAMRPQDAPDKISPDLLARLMLIWGIGSSRVTERDQTEGEVVLVRGLEAIYRELGGERIADAGANPGAFNSAGPRKETSKAARGIPRSDLSADEHVIAGAGSTAKVGEVPSASTLPLSHNCPVYNEGSSGFQLGWSANAAESISVGELVAVTHWDREGEESLRLGVVRWMRTERPQVIDFGVELIGGDVETVIFYRQWGGGQESYSSGLLLQRPQEDQTIITLPFFSEAGERTWLVTQGQKREIVLSREIEATGAFIQFYYHDQALPEPQAVDDQGIEVADFEQLWNSI
ncbi:hypothetical protein [Sedimenticola hydrogenitrophicus]|uniref:hypothetical protein n=1 Tax=Sedimenticola hydrogenitrophicus TaxID=2967975 RepID=UPI0021A81341|nr:hypothetical protein [Sedimenticola hydrogenitrophicus]